MDSVGVSHLICGSHLWRIEQSQPGSGTPWQKVGDLLESRRGVFAKVTALHRGGLAKKRQQIVASRGQCDCWLSSF